MSDPAAITAAVDHARKAFGEADILYNHAGQTIVKPFRDNTLADWNRLMAINVTSMFLMTQAVLPGMLAKGKGVIDNTSSVSAKLARPRPSGLPHVHQGDRHRIREQGIRCNAVAPASSAPRTVGGRSPARRCSWPATTRVSSMANASSSITD